MRDFHFTTFAYKLCFWCVGSVQKVCACVCLCVSSTDSPDKNCTRWIWLTPFQFFYPTVLWMNLTHCFTPHTHFFYSNIFQWSSVFAIIDHMRMLWKYSSSNFTKCPQCYMFKHILIEWNAALYLLRFQTFPTILLTPLSHLGILFTALYIPYVCCTWMRYLGTPVLGYG